MDIIIAGALLIVAILQLSGKPFKITVKHEYPETKIVTEPEKTIEEQEQEQETPQELATSIQKLMGVFDDE